MFNKNNSKEPYRIQRCEWTNDQLEAAHYNW